MTDDPQTTEAPHPAGPPASQSEVDERNWQAIRAVEAILPGTAIMLIVAPFGGKPGNRASYIGNDMQADMKTLMKEVIARWEGHIHTGPGRPQ